MFIDETTEKYLKTSGRLDSSKRIGLWRIIVARNLPYTDARRTGKVRVINFVQQYHECMIKIHIWFFSHIWH